jgi:hypothetical protein
MKQSRNEYKNKLFGLFKNGSISSAVPSIVSIIGYVLSFKNLVVINIINSRINFL